jgi:hypothetical protein
MADKFRNLRQINKIKRAALEGQTELNLSHNQLTSVPPEIAELTNLTSLKLWNNQLTSLPLEITELTNLTYLNLNGNQLTSVRPEIIKLTKLKILYLGRNQLTSVPLEITKLTALTALNLSHNQLTSVPPEISRLTNLTYLNLCDNKLPIPPETMADPKNVKAIFAALAESEREKRLNEAKILVIGEDKVGQSKEPQPKPQLEDEEAAQWLLLVGKSKELQPKPQQRSLRIVVASPNDVKPERDVLPSVIDEVNRYIAADRGLHLELSRWETDTHPGFHPEGPQGLIDPILKITDCDLLLGIFWKRLGTPTAGGKTGTEHEFDLAYEAWKVKRKPQIFFYFNEKPYLPKSKAEAEQWGQVIEFKDRFPKEGLWWPYKGKTQFEKQVRNHLINYIRHLS